MKKYNRHYCSQIDHLFICGTRDEIRKKICSRFPELRSCFEGDPSAEEIDRRLVNTMRELTKDKEPDYIIGGPYCSLQYFEMVSAKGVMAVFYVYYAYFDRECPLLNKIMSLLNAPQYSFEENVWVLHNHILDDPDPDWKWDADHLDFYIGTNEQKGGRRFLDKLYAAAREAEARTPDVVRLDYSSLEETE